MCLRFSLHWKRAFEIGWHTSGWVRIEENSSWGLEVLCKLFTACELENSQDEVDIRSACLAVHCPSSLYVSYPGALRKHWDPDLHKHVLPDSSAAKCTGFMLQVAPAKAAQVVCGVGLGTKSIPSLGPAQGPARCWSLSSRMPEPQADFC